MGYIITGSGAPSNPPPSILDPNNTQMLQGYFNSTHLSGLHIYYPPGNLPTPWPWILASMLLSLILGVVGLHSTFVSWKSEQESTRFAIARTTTAFAICCVRAVVAFAIALKATLVAGSNHPPPSSLLLLMGSVQTYIGSRSIPLICNFVLVLAQGLVYAALILALDNRSYGRFNVGGGNCPPDGGFDYAAPAFTKSCVNASRTWTAVGCQTLSSTDPNDYNHILYIEEITAYISGAYFLTIILALIDTFSIRRYALYHPVARDGSSNRLKFAAFFAIFSLVLGVVLTPIVVSAHYKQVAHPQTLTFVDSWGAYEKINRTKAEARNATTFGFGDDEHWTDCFNATVPGSRSGFWREWWRDIDPIARILAFV
ncbi:hypothetical protein K432DRAFT_38183 [Lepidopterella palustris CBS 459.81]|uniref:Uncharacterized protein n=1 Tax=Lepidopterella palustris CBS 459.81 TaxID=1314670 RepID=A0A8E2JFJ7_9PEZI|nr:hypothetical protein K432DRAFT_38183 [Lepidopterella palustris CBS 459.81]